MKMKPKPRFETRDCENNVLGFYNSAAVFSKNVKKF